MFDSLLSIGGSLLSGFLNNEAAEDRQNDAQNFSAQQFATRYQTTVNDMKAAGLNPMLAYSQGGGHPPSSSAASSQGYPDIGNTYLQSRMNSAQVANVEADTENKKAQADLIQSQIYQNYASAGSAEANARQADANTDRIREEIKNIPLEADRLVATAQMLREQASLMSQQSATQAEVTKVQAQTLLNLKMQNLLTEGQIAKIVSENKLLGFDIESAQKFGNLGRDAKQFGVILDILKTLAGRR